MSEDKLTSLQYKKFSCQSLTRVIASLEVHTTVSTVQQASLWLGQLAGEYSYFLCNNLSLKCKQKSLSFAATISLFIYILTTVLMNVYMGSLVGGWL